MNLPATPAPASFSFAPAASDAPDAGVSPKGSTASAKKATDGSPDFAALLALLFPGGPLAPGVAVGAAGGSGMVSAGDGKASAKGLSAGDNPLASPAGAQNPAQTPAGLSVANALDRGAKGLLAASGAPNAWQAPTGRASAQTAAKNLLAAPTAETAEKSGEALAAPMVSPADLPGLDPKAALAAPAGASKLTANAEARKSTGQATPTLDPKAIVTDNPPNVAQEKPSIHASALPGSDLLPSVPILAVVGAAAALQKNEPDSNVRDGVQAPAGITAPVPQADTATSSAAPTDSAPKPAVSFVDQVHSAFQNNLDNLREQGRVELHMDLHPPDLGKMRLHLSMEDNQLNVRMDVQDERAQQALEQQMQPMRVHFAEMGVNLGQLDVRRDGTGNTPQQNQNPDAPPSPTAPTQTSAESAKLRSPYDRNVNSDSMVDVLA